MRVNGAIWLPASTVSCAPARFDVNVTSTVFAVIFTIFVSVKPPLSVAVRKIWKYTKSPWSAMVNCPPAPVVE